MRGIGHPRGVDPEEGERCGCSVVTCEWMREDMVSPALVFTSIIAFFEKGESYGYEQLDLARKT